MRLHDITQTHDRPKHKRVGRGIAAGQGKTAGRGTKGQKSRTGANSNIPRTFEGGSTPLVQKLPKLKGFTSHRVRPLTLNIVRITAAFEEGSEISIATLAEKGLIVAKDLKTGIKIVGSSSKAAHSFTFDTADERLRFSTAFSASLSAPKNKK